MVPDNIEVQGVTGIEASKQGEQNNPLVLWYDKPAQVWTEALPLGNGRLGGMVYGGVSEDRIQLNEDTLWSGYPRDNNNYEAVKYLEQARKLLFEEKYVEADEIIERHMLATWTESYQPLGDLNLKFKGVDQPTHYRRELDLDTATTITTFESDGRIFTRKAFISAVDQVLAVSLECDKPGQLSFTISLSSLLPGSAKIKEGNILSFTGKCPAHVEPNYVDSPDPVIFDDKQTIEFEIDLQVFTDGGQLKINGNNELEIEKADRVTLHLAAATSFAGFDKSPATSTKNPVIQCEQQLQTAATYPLEELYSRHLGDYQPLIKRVELYLGTGPAISLPTDERLQRLQAGEEDPQLATLYFQYARYLMIASSRPGTQAANLQGIWNDRVRPPWSSNYTTNINAQMNYWPVEICNLSECHEPLFALIEELQINGQKTAQVHYNARGWVAHHNTDLWRHSAPAGGRAMWAFWPLGGVWLCQHLWEHYAFNMDRDFLAERAYPIMKDAAIFCLDWLVSDEAGNLVTNPSTSPENRFLTPDGIANASSVGSTADLVMILELFNHCIEASQLLDADPDFRAQLEEARARIKPFRIGSFGQLQEWSKDFDEVEPGHRHVSHLWGLYPGSLINLTEQPALAEASRQSLERRLSHGGGHTGWSSAWIINLWARLGDGEKAYHYFSDLVKKLTYPNLFDAHPPIHGYGELVFQIDGNFGGAAGLAEMLVQSQGGEIQLLPALPKAWSGGYVKGLKARGGFEINIAWENGQLVQAEVQSHSAQPCRIRASSPIKEVLCDGEAVKAERPQANTVQFQTQAGKSYLIR